MSEFVVDLQVIVDRTTAKMDGVAQLTARTLFNEMSSGGNHSPGTPVGNPSLWKHPAPPGYVGGTARNNWNAGVNARPEGGTTGDAVVEAVIGGFTADAGTLYITNTLPYIQRLEFGWSSHAPNGFVRPAAEAVQSIVAEVVAALT